MAEVYSNLAESTVLSVSGGGSINNTTDPVTFNVQVGDGAKFPVAATGGPDFFTAVLDTGNLAEIVHCQRTGDVITATRAQEGTAKVAHSLGTRFAHVVTAGSLTQIPAYVQAGLLTTKGALITRTAGALVSHPAGTNGQVLISDSTAVRGIRWGTASGAGLTGWVDVSTYAPGDGTNQRAGIQNAINALGGKAGVLWFPPGDYVIESPGVDSSGIPALTVMGPGFSSGSGSGNFAGGVHFYASNTRTPYVMWTHQGTGSANHQGVTFENVTFCDPNDNQKSLNAYNAATPGGVYSGGVITFTTTANHGFVAGDKVWVRNAWPKGYNGRWTVATTPTTTSFTVSSPWNPGAMAFPTIYTVGDPYQGGFVVREPAHTGLKILSETRWKITRCSGVNLRYGFNINAPGSSGDDASWGHAEDLVGSQCDVLLYYNGLGNYSTNVTGGNCQLGDDQVGYWFTTGAHQKIGNMKVDTSMPNGLGKSVVGDRAIGILFENGDSFSASQVDYEMESDSVCIATGTGTYTPSWAGAAGTSWTRTAAGATNTLAGTAGDNHGSISQFGMQHNDSNDGRGVVVLGSGHVDITDCQFHGSGFATCIDVGPACNGVTIKGGHDQISNTSHTGVMIRNGATNTDIIAFNRTNNGTQANHIVHEAPGTETSARTNVVAVHRTEGGAAYYAQH